MSTIEGEKENCASHYELILLPKFLILAENILYDNLIWLSSFQKRKFGWKSIEIKRKVVFEYSKCKRHRNSKLEWSVTHVH